MRAADCTLPALESLFFGARAETRETNPKTIFVSPPLVLPQPHLRFAPISIPADADDPSEYIQDAERDRPESIVLFRSCSIPLSASSKMLRLSFSQRRQNL